MRAHESVRPNAASNLIKHRLMNAKQRQACRMGPYSALLWLRRQHLVLVPKAQRGLPPSSGSAGLRALRLP